jgi:hypothetical protein
MEARGLHQEPNVSHTKTKRQLCQEDDGVRVYAVGLFLFQLTDKWRTATSSLRIESMENSIQSWDRRVVI